MEEFLATRKRHALERLSEYIFCDEERVCYTLIKQRMVAFVCGDLQMGDTVRIHHPQQEPSTLAYFDIKVVKLFRTVGLALFECKIDLCSDAPGLESPKQGFDYYQAGVSASQLPTFHEGVIISFISPKVIHTCGSLVSASDDQLSGGGFNPKGHSLFGICVGHEKDADTRSYKSYVSSVACFFL
jgi:hypothetical protein